MAFLFQTVYLLLSQKLKKKTFFFFNWVGKDWWFATLGHHVCQPWHHQTGRHCVPFHHAQLKVVRTLSCIWSDVNNTYHGKSLTFFTVLKPWLFDFSIYHNTDPRLLPAVKQAWQQPEHSHSSGCCHLNSCLWKLFCCSGQAELLHLQCQTKRKIFLDGITSVDIWNKFKNKTRRPRSFLPLSPMLPEKTCLFMDFPKPPPPCMSRSTITNLLSLTG